MLSITMVLGCLKLLCSERHLGGAGPKATDSDAGCAGYCRVARRPGSSRKLLSQLMNARCVPSETGDMKKFRGIKNRKAGRKDQEFLAISPGTPSTPARTISRGAGRRLPDTTAMQQKGAPGAGAPVFLIKQRCGWARPVQRCRRGAAPRPAEPSPRSAGGSARASASRTGPR